ncbi:hypothetical protein [Cryobacterium melibiosiphilum]|nr:hypothetical protein [Cryobacterium melibiosiphilum]
MTGIRRRSRTICRSYAADACGSAEVPAGLRYFAEEHARAEVSITV